MDDKHISSMEMMSPMVTNMPSIASSSNMDSRKYNEYEKDFYDKNKKKKKKPKSKSKIPPSPGLEKMSNYGNMDTMKPGSGNHYKDKPRDREDRDYNNKYNKKLNS